MLYVSFCMAKGRRLATSRSERFLGSCGYSNGHGMVGTDAAELGEEDVWSMVDDGGVTSGNGNNNHEIMHNSRETWSPRAGSESSSNNGSFSYRSRRRIPLDGRHVGGLSLAFEGSIPPSDKTAPSRIVHHYLREQESGVVPASPRHVVTSAPVNVPDWSKIYRVDSVDDGLDDRDTEMVPPHEYLAREFARRKKIGGVSVFEGVGRTLKGRDMWRVRDAVWSQTGFDG